MLAYIDLGGSPVQHAVLIRVLQVRQSSRRLVDVILLQQDCKEVVTEAARSDADGAEVTLCGGVFLTELGALMGCDACDAV